MKIICDGNQFGGKTVRVFVREIDSGEGRSGRARRRWDRDECKGTLILIPHQPISFKRPIEKCKGRDVDDWKALQ